MEKQFNPIQVAHWTKCGLSQEDAEFLAGIQYEGYTITLERQEEYESPRGQFDDDKALKWVQKQIRDGNEWGWFCARVVVSVPFPGDDDFEDDYIGCCSYKDRNDFIANSGYFVDMVHECYNRLKSRQAVNA
jgi:hypothetical protein